MKIALAQINSTVGDVAGNTAKVASYIEQAEAAGADLVVFSQLCLVGYPPGELLGREGLVAASGRAIEKLAPRCRKVAALVGYVRAAHLSEGALLENAVALLADGGVAAVHVKQRLSKHHGFDETGCFRPGPLPVPLGVAGRNVGVVICEDEPLPSATNATVVVNMCASPFQLGALADREQAICRQARRGGEAFVYVNQVGGNDELIFDGFSMAVGVYGTLLGRAKGFAEDLLVVDTAGPAGRVEPAGEEMAQLASALKLGLADYVHKCGFESVVLGLSGGIDSAVVAALAADALGPQNVITLAMPSRHSSERSLADARQLAANLGVKLTEVPIDSIHQANDKTFDAVLPADRPGTTDENIQARIRGNLIMAFSNAAGHLAIATGNKSELATGYCTMYGDMTGGLAVIGDVPKTMVYALARHLNAAAGTERIPESILAAPPSAELRPNQTDQDKLPAYDVLDDILRRHLEQGESIGQIVEQGFDEPTVRRIVEMAAAAEFKRRQAPPALKVTSRPFGTGRQMPIACRREFD